MTDKIYGYESITKVSGEIKDDSFNPMIYKSKTKSSKQDRFENIIFNKNGTISVSYTHLTLPTNREV